jgi:uncharacterized protein YjbI with pentapeptide repeats
MGFITCIVTISICLIIFIWPKKPFSIKAFTKMLSKGTNEDKNSIYAYVWLLVLIFFLFGVSINSFLTYKQNELLKIQSRNQRNHIAQQAEAIEAKRNSSIVYLISILEKINQELNSDPKRILSDQVIDKIHNLSFALRPYHQIKANQKKNETYKVSKNEISLERGTLLLSLVKMKIDTVSFCKLKKIVPFSGADLRGAKLTNLDLNHIDLRESVLNDAELSGVNFRNSNLDQASLWGAKINNADLSNASLKNTDIRWAELNNTNLKKANFNGADLGNAKLKMSDMKEAQLKWSNLKGALLNNAILKGANLKGANLSRTDLSAVDLSQTDMTKVNLCEAKLYQAKINDAQLDKVMINDKDWLNKLEKWEVSGAKKIIQQYRVVINPSNDSDYVLKKI